MSNEAMLTEEKHDRGLNPAAPDVEEKLPERAAMAREHIKRLLHVPQVLRNNHASTVG